MTRLEDLRGLVDSAAAEELPEIIGALEGAKARAFARLTTGATTTGPAPLVDRLLTMRAVAKRLRINENLAREMGRRHELPVTTVGKRFVRVRASALEEWIRQREGATLARPGGR